MNFLQRKVTGLASAPKSRLIWMAFAVFLLGNAFCPFSPPSGDRVQITQERETMNTQSHIEASQEKMQTGLLASSSSEVQTATFALG